MDKTWEQKLRRNRNLMGISWSSLLDNKTTYGGVDKFKVASVVLVY